MAYIGVEPCGCVMAVTLDMPDMKRETARFVAQLVRSGCTVERVPLEEARERFVVRCEHEDLPVGDPAQLTLASAYATPAPAADVRSGTAASGEHRP